MTERETELQLVLDRTVQFVTEMLPSDGGCSLVLWDETNQKFTRSATTVPDQVDKQLAANRVRKTGGATRWIVDHRQHLIVSDIRNDPFVANTILTDYAIQAYVGIPLIVDDKVEGVLYAMNLVPRAYTDGDVRLLYNCADIIALAISKSRTVVELEEANQALELYVRTVTHDVKSPLSVAIGYIHMITADYHLLPDPEKKTYLNSAEQMLVKSFQIIDELLLLTEIRSETPVNHGVIDMSLIMNEIKLRIQPLLEESNGSIEIPDVWDNRVLGYAPWVEEIWVNYISNAIKYGGTPPRITIGATRRETDVKFWIKDNGQGLTPEEQDTLFTPFTRFNHVRVKGHGLGLSIVKYIAERMNGDVGVTSQVGQGSEFYFTLPCAPELHPAK